MSWGTATVAACLAVVLSDAGPTGIGWIDAIQRATAVAVVVLAAPLARRWAPTLGSGLVALASTGAVQVVGLVSLALAVLLVFTDRRSRLIAAPIGGLVALVALHLDVAGPTGTETAVGLAAVAPILMSSYRYLPGRLQRRWRLAGLVGVVFTLLAVGLAGAAALSSIGPIEDAVAATRRGVASAQDGDGDAASKAFHEARKRFGDADARIGAWWASSARLLPLVGPNLGATQDVVGLGQELTAVARDITGDVDFDRVQRPDGGVDLEVLAGFEENVITAARTLDDASAGLEGLDSPWIVAPLHDRLVEFSDEVAELDSQTEAAALGVTDGPALLGADGPRRYLFLLGNPAELRDIGGHVGNWVEIVADDGRLEMVEVGGPLDLSVRATETPRLVRDDFPPSLAEMRPSEFPQNWGASPDLPTVARLAAELFEFKTGRSVDGVVYADPRAFAAMLGIAGPVVVRGPAQSVELTSDNAERFLTHGQFVVFRDERAAGDALEVAIEEVFDRLTSSELPGPRQLSETFYPLVRDGHFRLATLHAEDTELLERFGLRGALPEVGGGDLLAVIQRNANPSKIDAFLRRYTDVDIQWSPESGAVNSVVSVELHNDAVGDLTNRVVFGNDVGAVPGTNVTDVTVVTPLRLRAVLVDGEKLPGHPVLEGGLWRHTARVQVPAGEAVTVIFHLEGEVTAGSTYRLRFHGQPILGENRLTARVTPSVGRPRSSSDDAESTDPGRLEVDANGDHVFEWRSGVVHD